MNADDLIDDPCHQGKHIDVRTGVWPTSEWGSECSRAFNGPDRQPRRAVAKKNCQRKPASSARKQGESYFDATLFRAG
jgi:hypothetical protein